MNATQYVYVKSEPGIWTVGFYDPSGKWHSDSDHDSKQEAASRVAWLNGHEKNSEDAIEGTCRTYRLASQ